MHAYPVGSAVWAGSLCMSIAFAAEDTIPAEVERAHAQLLDDIDRYTASRYEMTYTATTVALLQGGEVVPLDAPLVSTGRIRFARHRDQQWIHLIPEETAELHEEVLQRSQFLQQGGMVTILHEERNEVVIDSVERVAAKPRHVSIPHDRFTYTLARDWVKRFANLPPELEEVMLRDVEVSRYNVPNEHIPELPRGADADITIREEFTVTNPHTEKMRHHAREIRYAADQAWRPRRIKRIENHSVIVVYDLEWFEVPDWQTWFPRTIRSLIYSPIGEPHDNRALLRENVVVVDPVTFAMGDELLAEFDFSITIPEDAQIRRYEPGDSLEAEIGAGQSPDADLSPAVQPKPVRELDGGPLEAVEETQAPGASVWR